MPLAAFRPLRHRSYARLWGAGLISNAGSWMQAVAVGALVTTITRQAAWTALSFVAAFLPNGVLAPIAGALADRVDRRRFLILANLAEASLATVLAVLVAAGMRSPVVIVAIVFLEGCTSAMRIPFVQSMLPDLVPRDDLLAAISLSSAQWNLGRVLGPALAGVTIAATSFSVAFAVNAASYLVVIAALARVELPRHQ
ncbi:MAG: MFS transporter, partial [Acidimicrobiales bacterium]